MKKTVNLVGGRGYTGSELLRLLASHPGLELGVASSRSMAGQPVRAVCDSWPDGSQSFVTMNPGTVSDYPADAWVLAMPNGLAHDWIEPIREACPGAVILDLSADYRFDPHWTYGLPERNRDQIASAKLIANPGCYATGAQLGLLPVRERLASAPVIFGVSGYSGAGKTPSPRNDPEMLRDNLMPYSLTGHVHEHEVSHQLGMDVRFMPHVASFFRGISLTIAIELEGRASVDDLEEIYREAYGAEPFVDVTTEPPQVRARQGSPGATVGGFAVDQREPSRASLVVVLDNLLKGAASQAVQNLNLSLGWPEGAGLEA